MQFDVILTNPPFQDSVVRGKTPHKLWIDFTKHSFGSLLREGGILCQVSPGSFRSPSNDILDLMKRHETLYISLDAESHFPEVGSSFSHYAIRKAPQKGMPTKVYTGTNESSILLDNNVFYLPNDFCALSMSIHRKVIFSWPNKLGVKWDYVTCHNIKLRTSDTLSKTKTDVHRYPVFHTNRQIWWSSIQQEWAGLPKVMWTRSGYTKPFFDEGELGGTDMVYYVPVRSAIEGEHLVNNLNTRIMKYILRTARWSGFGNEKVFRALPALPVDHSLSDPEAFEFFGLCDEEVQFVDGLLG